MAQSEQQAGGAGDAGIALAELALTAEEAQRAARVDFAVDREGELPLGTQLDWKLRGMMVRGVLRPGDRLPSVRELADFAGVNVNTARAVYAELEGDELIASQQGRGTFVGGAAADLARLGPLADEAIASAQREEVDHRALAAAVYFGGDPAGDASVIAPFPDVAVDGDPKLVRDELRSQIGRLEAEIATYAWDDPARAPQARPRGCEPLGRVVSVEELERTRAELIDRLRRLRGEAARRGSRQQAVREHLESVARHPEEHRWERIPIGATGDPGCGEWRVVPAWGPVGAIMGWWRVKVSSGCP